MSKNSEGRIPVFVSSAHYGLEDLRGELTSFLSDYGVVPVLSSEEGFPDYAGISPYAQCLRALEPCMVVVVIIDRRYGTPLKKNWEPFEQYNGLSATHAEVRHALSLKKRILVYARQDVLSQYEIYRLNPDQYKDLNLPHGLDLMTLELLKELKLSVPAPWIEPFKDIRDVKASIRGKLLGDLYEAFLLKEKLAEASAELLIERILKLSPEMRETIMTAVSGEDQEYLKSLENSPNSETKEKLLNIASMLEKVAGGASIALIANATKTLF